MSDVEKHRSILDRYAAAALNRGDITIRPVPDGVFRLGDSPWLYEYEKGICVRIAWDPRPPVSDLLAPKEG